MIIPPDPATALLVIDVQIALFNSQPPPLEGETVIRNINDLIQRGRPTGLHVCLIQHEGSAEDGVEPGSPGWALHPALLTLPADPRFRKTACDAFFRTPLESALQARGVRHVIVTGYATDFCIDSTVRSACSKGFEVTVPADAHTTNDTPVLTAEQVRRHHNWVWANCTVQPPIRVVPTNDVRFGSVA